VSDQLKIDLFSVGRRSFPSWERCREVQSELSRNSLIELSHDEVTAASEQRAKRLAELIDEEATSGVSYFCERIWLEEIAGRSGRSYKSWLAEFMRFFTYRAEPQEQTDREHRCVYLKDFRIPPLLSDRSRGWIELNKSSIKCIIYSSVSSSSNGYGDNDWFVQTAHLMQNLNYYIEMVAEQSTVNDRANVCRLEYLRLDTDMNHSQVWSLTLKSNVGEYTRTFLRNAPIDKECRQLPTDSQYWYPGCPEGIPEIDPISLKTD